MPQMAPLSWLTLLMYFIMIFGMFNLTNYFSIKYTQKKMDAKMFKKTTTKNWTW